MDILEDDMELIMLYHHIPSQHTKFGQASCAYSNPSFGQMFKVNVMTDGNEMVNAVKVTIYDSLEKCVRMSILICVYIPKRTLSLQKK